MSDVLHERRTGGGTTVTYPGDLGEAWEIARTVFQWEVGEPIESHRDEGYLLTGTETDAFSWGTVMGAIAILQAGNPLPKEAPRYGRVEVKN